VPLPKARLLSDPPPDVPLAAPAAAAQPFSQLAFDEVPSATPSRRKSTRDGSRRTSHLATAAAGLLTVLVLFGGLKTYQAYELKARVKKRVDTAEKQRAAVKSLKEEFDRAVSRGKPTDNARTQLKEAMKEYKDNLIWITALTADSQECDKHIKDLIQLNRDENAILFGF
jgi:hypothetical protein